MRERERLSPTGLPWPREWSGIRRHGRTRSAVFAAVGVVLLVFAGLFAAWPTAPEDAHMAWAFVPLGVGVLLVSFVVRVGTDRSAVFVAVLEDGDERVSGAAFPVRREVRPATATAAVLFGAGALGMFLSPDPAVGADPVMLAIGTVLVVAGIVAAAARTGFRGVVLAPGLVVVRTALFGRSERLAWEDVLDVIVYEAQGGPAFALVPVDLDVFGTDRRDRLRAAFGEGRVEVHAGRFGVDPALLLLALRHYLHHPGDRRELGTREAVERIRAGRFPG
ncbi:hypothetical protein [Actinomadura rifamycini]|uniref:hypothetical protein n=1 Tax=Actinomadura rifamycini TaxID=31962 RepID=UPI000426A989|nr:hypothetical protein [Actinomadura rifamycini]